MLLSSHFMGEVEQVCDRVGVIHRGKLVAEGTVAELRGHKGGILVRAEPLDQAKSVVAEELLGSEAVEVVDDEMLRIFADAERADEIGRELVAAGVGVREVRRAKRSLEDAFLKLTGEKGENE